MTSSGTSGSASQGGTATPADSAAPGAGTAAVGAGPGWGTWTGKPTVTLLLRHGATEMSAERRFAGRGDIALTNEGIKQAGLAARKLAAAPGVDVILTSPLQRARRTAEAVAETTGAPLIVDDDLVEADFGQWQGLTFAEARERWPDQLTAWLATPDAAPPGGESFAIVATRVLAALDRLVDAHKHKRAVLVSHVTPIKTLICRALLAPPEAMFRMNLDVASLTRIDNFDNGSALLRSLNDTSHLEERRRRRWF
ncbi:MAG: histidine phosphatase family protein [Streptosporangiaceae bacterium]